jgi:hypothetical protein
MSSLLLRCAGKGWSKIPLSAGKTQLGHNLMQQINDGLRRQAT